MSALNDASQPEAAQDTETLIQESARMRAKVRAAAERHSQAVVDLTKTMEESQRLVNELRHVAETLPSPMIVVAALVPPAATLPTPSPTEAASVPHDLAAASQPTPPPQIVFVKRGTLYQC